VRPEWLGALKKVIYFIGSRTRDLPARNITPQPSTLQLMLQLINTETTKI
jgi:hypothetical protein